MDHAEHRREFEQQGYTILRGFFSEEEMAEAIHDIRTADPRQDQPSGLNKGQLRFYSNVFFKSPKLQAFVANPRLVDLMTTVIGPDVWVRWDQAVAKGPGATEFPWHQDNGYSKLRDPHFQLWVALTRMTKENGGLWIQPGSHRGPLPHSPVGNHVKYDGEPESPVFIEAEPGDVVLFSSFTLHRTTPNVSDEDRWAYVVEYMSCEHFDPFADPPYFIVAKDGAPTREFVRTYRGRQNPINQAKYFVPRARKAIRSVVRAGKRAFRAAPAAAPK